MWEAFQETQTKLPLPRTWRERVPKLFGAYFWFGFSPPHEELWTWANAIEAKSSPSPFVAIWPRARGKSTTTEAVVADLAIRAARTYCLYVCSTQDQADKHVQTIARMLESDTVARHEPNIGKPKVSSNGNRTWNRKMVTTATGFTIEAIGLDKAVRGQKIDWARPDMIVCHKKGTMIQDGGKWLTVENHPTAKSFVSNGYEVSLWGLPFAETVSSQHPYWVKQLGYTTKHNTGRLEDKGTGWLEANRLNTHSFIGTPIDYTEIDPPAISRYVPGSQSSIRDDKGRITDGGGRYEKLRADEFYDPEWWWFFGLWWGDGHLAGKHQIGITVANTQPEITQRIASLLGRYGVAHSITERAGCHQVVFCRTHLYRWLKTWKHGNSMKLPPPWVEKLPKAYQRELVRGYIDSDGFVDTKSKQIRITSVYLDGLLSLQRILSRFDIPSSIRRGAKGGPTTIMGVPCNSKQKYDIQFRQNVCNLGYDIGNQERYAYTRAFIEDGFLWRKVREITEVDSAEFVPIKTASGTYITHFGLSHNCDDIDEVHDSELTTTKKEEIITASIVPAGATNCAVLFVQNLIHSNSIASRLAKTPNQEGAAHYLMNRTVSGPFAAVEGLQYEQQQRGELWRWVITAGKSLWNGYDLAICEDELNRVGPAAYERESQNDVDSDNPHALMSAEDFERTRVTTHPDLVRVAIAVDPPGGATECGIVAVGKAKVGKDFHGYTLEDATVAAGVKPEVWALEVLKCYYRHNADVIFVERNYGGDMVTSTIRQVKWIVEGKVLVDGAKVKIVEVTATRGKVVRAEPVAVVFQQGRGHQVGRFYELEKEWRQYAPGDKHSPNRLDAMVWGYVGLELTGMNQLPTAIDLGGLTQQSKWNQ